MPVGGVERRQHRLDALALHAMQMHILLRPPQGKAQRLGGIQQMPVMVRRPHRWRHGPDPVGCAGEGLACRREQGMILCHRLGAGGSQDQHAGDLADRLAQLLEMRPRFEHVADRALVEPIGEFPGEAVVILAAAGCLVLARIQ